MNSKRANAAFDLLQTSTGEALECLASSPLDDETVHTARKALKKARAGLRLLRPMLDDEEYQTHNIALRDAGRCLSPLRDARILLTAIDSLAESGVGKQAQPAIEKLLKLMRRRLSAERHKVIQPEVLRRCVNLIKASRDGLAWQVLAASTDALNRGFLQIYRKTRKAFRRAREENTTQTMHEWRKQTKYLRAAAATLRTSENHELHRTEKSADEISDWLGDDHDLAVLDDLVRERVSSGDSEQLRQFIEARRTKLQHKAFTAGEELLAKKPKRFLANVLR